MKLSETNLEVLQLCWSSSYLMSESISERQPRRPMYTQLNLLKSIHCSNTQIKLKRNGNRCVPTAL